MVLYLGQTMWSVSIRLAARTGLGASASVSARATASLPRRTGAVVLPPKRAQSSLLHPHDVAQIKAGLERACELTHAFSFIPEVLPITLARSKYDYASPTQQHLADEEGVGLVKAVNSVSPSDSPAVPRLLEDYTVGVKDVMDVKGMPTSMGRKPSGPAATQDSFIVGRLRAAGALIVAKTNVPEGGIDVQTFNSAFGVTLNPWDTSKTPAGSSGGSAVAVATRATRIAVGSDLRGSLRLPAAFCGVCSLRSTPGRISPAGHSPVLLEGPAAESTVVVGPMAVDVATLDRCFQACVDDYNTMATLKSLKVYITPSFANIPTDDRIVAFFEQELPAQLRTLGVQVEVGPGPELNHKDINKACEVFVKELLEADKAPKGAMEVAVQARTVARKAITEHLERTGCCWIHPVCSVLPYAHNPEHKDIAFLYNGADTTIPYWTANLGYVTPISVTGHPVLTFPFGLVDGMPLGGQIVGLRHEDEGLLAAGRYLENILARLPRPPISV